MNIDQITDKNLGAKLQSRITPEEVDGYRNSALWTYRAMGIGLALLGMTKTELEEALLDDERFALICQIYKMLIVDQSYAEKLAALRAKAMERIAGGLVERNHPDTETLLKSPIDFSLIPDVPAAPASLINSLRP